VTQDRSFEIDFESAAKKILAKKTTVKIQFDAQLFCYISTQEAERWTSPAENNRAKENPRGRASDGSDLGTLHVKFFVDNHGVFNIRRHGMRKQSA